mgnify:CR=1 FL=1
MPTLQAIIFDFDGVIANTEPLHFAGLHQTLKEIGIELTEPEYYAEYLGYDDRGCILAALAANRRPADRGTVVDNGDGSVSYGHSRTGYDGSTRSVSGTVTRP